MSAVDANRFRYLTEHVASLAQAANAAALMASNPYEYYFGLNSPVKPAADPTPQLNYAKLYYRVRCCVPYVNREQQKAFLKAYEYTAESRANYLVINEKFHHTYHGLQDARAFHTIMVDKKAELEKTLAILEEKEGMELAARKKRTELEAIKLQIQKNADEVPDLLARTRELAARREAICSSFSALKKQLHEEKLPELLYIARQVAQRKGVHSTRKGL